MTQRRSLFEVLGIFTYVIAVFLAIFSILNWTSQPLFVAGCTAIWTLFSMGVVIRLWRGNHKEKVLEIPDAWEVAADNNQADGRNTLEFNTPEIESNVLVGVQVQSSPVQLDIGTQAVDKSVSMTAASAPARSAVIDIHTAETIKSGLRTVRLQQYRQERLSRYRQKRRSRRAVASNLAIYRQQSGNYTSNGN